VVTGVSPKGRTDREARSDRSLLVKKKKIEYEVQHLREDRTRKKGNPSKKKQRANHGTEVESRRASEQKTSNETGKKSVLSEK